MRIPRTLAFVILLLFAGGSARAEPAADIAQLTRQADAWDKAIVAKDLVGIAANLCDDFRQIGSSGEVENRESFLRDLMSTELEIDPYTVEEFEIRLYGDTSLAQRPHPHDRPLCRHAVRGALPLHRRLCAQRRAVASLQRADDADREVARASPTHLPCSSVGFLLRRLAMPASGAAARPAQHCGASTLQERTP